MVEDIHFAKLDDGKTVMVGTWPQHAEFSRELLNSSPLITVEDGYIEISVFNGVAFYEITGTRPGTGIVEPVVESVITRLVTGFVGFDR